MPSRRLIVALLALALAVSLLALPAAAGSGRVYASWYGPGFYGHRLCDGRTVLTPSTLEVASRAYRCGSRITVCYRRCVNAVVLDYGPASWTGRDMDLANGVARAIGFAGVGYVRVVDR